MSDTAERLRTELNQLPYEERAKLAEFLLDSLEGPADAEAQAAFDATLARRLEEFRRDRSVTIPGDVVFAELRRKYP